MTIHKLPTLSFVPVDSLLMHEHHDETRTRPLILRIRASAVFRNPPIVTPLNDGSGRYMMLDGANRTMAIRAMAFPHILVQVIEPDDPGLLLQTWNHIVWELNPRSFIDGLRRMPGIYLKRGSVRHAELDLESASDLVLVRTPSGSTYKAVTEENGLENRVLQLNRVVDSYRQRARLDRTFIRDVRYLREIYPLFSGLVIFPQFQMRDVLMLASQHCLLPSGITRFTISPRALHVNYPLEEFVAEKSLDEKNEDLQLWLQDRLARKTIRYYAEPTFLFDE